MHELLEELAVTAAAVPPDVGQEPLGADHVPRLRDQDLQEPRLEPRQLERRAARNRERLRLEVERELAGGERVAGLDAGAPEQGLDAREQRARAEGLDRKSVV